MHLPSVKLSLAAILAASAAQAQYLVNELSFGHNGRILTPIPNFKIKGSPTDPDVLSNKIVLTPPAPGNHRSSIWTESPLFHRAWTTDVSFRATGPERGGGNLNIWLVRGGDSVVGTNSVYSVGRFDGLALVIDTHGGSGGMIRGFLNDGTTDFSAQPAVDELAFGHCLYSYRNLGRPSQIKLKQTEGLFRVEVDDELCFETTKVRLPTGNYLGITAGTPDNPDSFEVFKMTVMSESLGADPYKKPPEQRQQEQQPIGSDQSTGESINEIPDEDADIFSTSKMQFQDLHNRLQSVTHQISAVHRSIAKNQQMQETRHGEMREMLNEIKSSGGGSPSNTYASTDSTTNSQVSDLERRMVDLEREIRGMRQDLTGKIKANERAFKGFLTDHHATLTQTVLDSMPGHKRIILVFIGTQVVLAGAYVLYKRRRATMPKKYL